MSFSPAIRNWQAQPPVGGWALTYSITDGSGEEHKWFFQGLPHSIIEGVAEVQKANNIFDGYGKIWDWANDTWTKRDPKRALSYSREDGTYVASPMVSGAVASPTIRGARSARVTKPCSRC